MIEIRIKFTLRTYMISFLTAIIALMPLMLCLCFINHRYFFEYMKFLHVWKIYRSTVLGIKFNITRIALLSLKTLIQTIAFLKPRPRSSFSHHIDSTVWLAFFNYNSVLADMNLCWLTIFNQKPNDFNF